MNIYTPYTYLIGWSKHNKWYYGRRTAKNCNPSEFWVNYFTSSKYVEEFRKQFGEPDIIQIRKTFSDPELCCIWEEKVIDRLKIVKNPSWLNRSNSGRYFNTNGVSIPSTRKGIQTGIDPWNKGKTGVQTAWNKGKPATEEQKKKDRKSTRLNSSH